MTPHQARQRFAAARVPRLATAEAARRPHIVPVTFLADRYPRFAAREAVLAVDAAGRAGPRRLGREGLPH